MTESSSRDVTERIGELAEYIARHPAAYKIEGNGFGLLRASIERTPHGLGEIVRFAIAATYSEGVVAEQHMTTRMGNTVHVACRGVLLRRSTGTIAWLPGMSPTSGENDTAMVRLASLASIMGEVCSPDNAEIPTGLDRLAAEVQAVRRVVATHELISGPAELMAQAVIAIDPTS